MENRFKFRVWNKLFNTMTYNFMFGNFMQKSLEDYEKKDWVGLNYEPDYICYNNKAIEDNLVIMQCTGLKDENCKLIYEGDIVKTLYTKPNDEIINRNCVVEYNRGAFWINYGIGASYLYNDECIYEIIGNIFQDKELLNEIHS